jgi:hypothetical protein
MKDGLSMTKYGIDRLIAGLDVTLGSSRLPYGIRIKDNTLQVFTAEASMTIPLRLLDELIDIKNQLPNSFLEET